MTLFGNWVSILPASVESVRRWGDTQSGRRDDRQRMPRRHIRWMATIRLRHRDVIRCARGLDIRNGGGAYVVDDVANLTFTDFGRLRLPRRMGC
jgi:hypothetical protein